MGHDVRNQTYSTGWPAVWAIIGWLIVASALGVAVGLVLVHS